MDLNQLSNHRLDGWFGQVGQSDDHRNVVELIPEANPFWGDGEPWSCSKKKTVKDIWHTEST
jgi:hypothetical protein